jgi:hypothetical protein
MDETQYLAWQAARVRQAEKAARWRANHAKDKPIQFPRVNRPLAYGERRVTVGTYVETPEIYPED